MVKRALDKRLQYLTFIFYPAIILKNEAHDPEQYPPNANDNTLMANAYIPIDGKVPSSVTTILDRTKSEEKKQALANWKKRVGSDLAQQITTEAASRGTRMHKYLEDFCETEELKKPGSNPYSQQANKMAEIIVDNGLSNLDECWGTEVPLYFPELYAGTTDCVGVYNGVPAIVDFKQTNKPKKDEWVDDYKLQLVFMLCSMKYIIQISKRRYFNV